MSFITRNMPALMFAGMILFMLIGYPAAFSLLAPVAQKLGIDLYGSAC